MDLLTDPGFCEAVIDQTLKFWLDCFRLFLDEAGDVVDVIMIGDDLAARTAPGQPGDLPPPRQPRQKRLLQYIRSRTKAKIWYHTCGSCAVYIPDLLDTGHSNSPTNNRVFFFIYLFATTRLRDVRGLRSQHILSRGTPAKSRPTSAFTSRHSCPGAAMSSTASTTSRAKPATSSRCLTRPTKRILLGPGASAATGTDWYAPEE